MKVNKDAIRQIILDFNNFKNEDVWLCSFEDIVDEFINTQEIKYSVDEGE